MQQRRYRDKSRKNLLNRICKFITISAIKSSKLRNNRERNRLKNDSRFINFGLFITKYILYLIKKYFVYESDEKQRNFNLLQQS